MQKIEFSNTSVENTLTNISLTITESELFMVKGSSLRELKTFLMLCHQIIKPSSGSIKIFNQEKNLIGSNLVPLINDLTVEETLLIPLISINYSVRESQRRIEEITSYFSINHLLKHKVSSLSSKEYALVGITKAVIKEPSLLILDSFSHLIDHKLSVLVMTYLHEIAVEHQVTIVMIENDIKLHPFAGKILHLEDGCIKDLVGEGVDLQKLMPFLKI